MEIDGRPELSSQNQMKMEYERCKEETYNEIRLIATILHGLSEAHNRYSAYGDASSNEFHIDEVKKPQENARRTTWKQIKSYLTFFLSRTRVHSNNSGPLNERLHSDHVPQDVINELVNQLSRSKTEVPQVSIRALQKIEIIRKRLLADLAAEKEWDCIRNMSLIATDTRFFVDSAEHLMEMLLSLRSNLQTTKVILDAYEKGQEKRMTASGLEDIPQLIKRTNALIIQVAQEGFVIRLLRSRDLEVGSRFKKLQGRNAIEICLLTGSILGVNLSQTIVHAYVIEYTSTRKNDCQDMTGTNFRNADEVGRLVPNTARLEYNHEAGCFTAVFKNIIFTNYEFSDTPMTVSLLFRLEFESGGIEFQLSCHSQPMTTRSVPDYVAAATPGLQAAPNPTDAEDQQSEIVPKSRPIKLSAVTHEISSIADSALDDLLESMYDLHWNTAH